ncbi:lytic polysaccharide monooxygenase [Kitasatospora sp. GP82]|uniref:lytic polysaccharide monooxygenase n=1 Tax=Kitasatospora sp. GP82 TaxID=3035089 RepID=UPI0024749A43|nr:lytic polysaccharide monooxygenase [Kitasatospora sp. GP82]MDH6129576.1 putative carbohydrate-binding protein with CBM5 and CBM33 domain [Kitasatospora sp. GP82]
MPKRFTRGLVGALGALTLSLAALIPAAQADQPTTRHGTLAAPVSRALLCHPGGLDSPDPMCQAARQAGIYLWQEVQPEGSAMKADPPFNARGRYSEYRKFSPGANVCSAGNPKNAGLDLRDSADRKWKTTDLSGTEGSYTFQYRYTAKHPGEYWTHEWYVTKDGWDPAAGVSWSDVDPVPFMVGHFDSMDQYPTETLPPKSGRHVIVEIWSGPGGPDLDPDKIIDPQFPKAGEFFTSCSDVDFG